MIEIPRPQQFPAHPGPHRCGGECACGVEPLAHPKYSFGMLLEARHLALEHRYAAMRMNTHDIRLHDFGTVCGLRVDEHPAPDCVNSYAILRAGIALDCCGREIVIPEPLYVPLYDGAQSGWCGAPVALQAPPATPAAKRTKLCIYLQYQECDTDPVPMYVRTCGCCENPCEQHGCVPSVTREGYLVTVSTAPPPVWRNPIGEAFCTWLDAKLKGPGVSPNGYVLVDQDLDRTLCDVVTEPCANFCDAGNDKLLLATLAFDANDTLQTIDNCTGRRLVIPTAALFEAVECLATAVTACCASQDAFLTLAGDVSPATVNLEALPPGDALTYTMTVNDADATKAAGGFTMALAFPPGLTFSSATLTVDGATQPHPAGDATGVKAPVAGLAAGKTAVLMVVATFDPSLRHAGDVLTATASVEGYSAQHGPPVPLNVTFTDVKIDGPRVEYTGLPTTLTASDFIAFIGAGVPLPFDEVIDPSSAVIDPAAGDVFLELIHGTTVSELPVKAVWSNGNQLLTLTYNNPAVTYSPLTLLVQQIESDPGPQWSARIRLLGGTKGTGPSTGPSLKTPDGRRLDGDPPQGGPPQQIAGESGNGTQGGDFIWNIAITVPVPDGPHVEWKASQLPATTTFTQALSIFSDNGANIEFDQQMDQTLPPTGPVSTGIIKMAVGATALPVVVRWVNATTMNVRSVGGSLRPALDAIEHSGGTLTITLAGGPKGGGASPSPAMQSTGNLRLDGSPAQGTGALASSGLSGDGRQGGDFVWNITIPPA